MRTSREWIASTIAELNSPAPDAVPPAPAAHPTPARLTLELELSPEERRALDEICAADELSPQQALAQVVRARLWARPQFGRADRARLRACLELLRALEQHVGRAARPAGGKSQTAEIVSSRANELLELGAYLRRIGRAIGESMLGNLDYWRGEDQSPAAEAADEVRKRSATGPSDR